MSIARALTRRYVMALVLVALLSTAAWFSLHLVIAEQKSTAAVVNVSGRQRMLSQRTALLSNLLVSVPRVERTLVRGKLQEAVDLMARSHRGLTQGDREMGLPATMSPAVQALYFGGADPLDTQVLSYLKTVQDLLLEDSEKLHADSRLIRSITDTASSSLVVALDQMVQLYQAEGEATIRRLQNAETSFWLGTLLLLILEAMLIFHPFIRYLRLVIAKLQRATGELQLHQDHLDEVIRQRTIQLEDKGKELAESEEKFRVISTEAQDAIAIVNADEQVIFWNPAAEKIFGYRADEATGRNLHNLLSPANQRDAAHGGFKVFSDTGEGKFVGKTFEIIALKKSGVAFPIELSISAVQLQNRWHALGIIRDITQRKNAEEKILLAASVFTHAREAIAITDTDGTIIEVNGTFTRITGYSRDEVLGQNPRILSSGLQGKDYYIAMWHGLKNQGYWSGEIWNRRKNGEVYAEMLTISAVLDTEGITRHYVALFSDITSFKEHQTQLEHIAHYDALTSLPNRVLLADRLQQAMALAQRNGQRLAVAYLDLDGFKAINDTHGHAAGDQLLVTVAMRMKQALRECDTLARMGGDEFVAVLLDLADNEASAPMLTRLLAAAAQPVKFGDILLQVSASLGVAFYQQAEDLDAEQLLRQADQAMYQAKLAGKNRYHIFDTELDRSIRSHHESIAQIRRALAKGEFVLYYQPKVNMRTGTVIGAEALIRWQHPEKGLLPPDTFLPSIENHQLAVEVGEWVIDTALKQMILWRVSGLDIPVSVNVSARQLQQTDFVARLREILAKNPSFRQNDLELEVLETSALDDLDRVSRIIDDCSEIGVKFAMDDFGTGYSSLTYLKLLPVTLLKIDQTFVRDMLGSPDDLAILDGVIGLAIAFRRQVIAEGVETVEHGEMLLRLGCEMAQGYGIARPMPADMLPSWAAGWRSDPAWANLPAASRDDIPLLFASVEHRSWIANIENFLRGEHEAPPTMDHLQCRFGKWLKCDGQARYGAQPAFQSIELLHQQVHVLAVRMLELKDLDLQQDALAKMGQLHGLRDAMLAQLKVLVLKSK